MYDGARMGNEQTSPPRIGGEVREKQTWPTNASAIRSRRKSWSGAGLSFAIGMREAHLDALVVQGANGFAAGGGYFRWLTGIAPLGTLSADGGVSARCADDHRASRSDAGSDAKLIPPARPDWTASAAG